MMNESFIAEAHWFARLGPSAICLVIYQPTRFAANSLQIPNCSIRLNSRELSLTANLRLLTPRTRPESTKKTTLVSPTTTALFFKKSCVIWDRLTQEARRLADEIRFA